MSLKLLAQPLLDHDFNHRRWAHLQLGWMPHRRIAGTAQLLLSPLRRQLLAVAAEWEVHKRWS